MCLRWVNFQSALVGHFYIGGNNWTAIFNSGSPNDPTSAVIVGAVSWNNALASFSSTPGSNSIIQSRWITALGENILTAGGISNTVNSTTNTKGTSFATPLVSRALNIAKSYCSSMTYNDIADVMLQTANRSFTGYSAENYGMGILDVNALMKHFESNGCTTI